MQRRFGEDTDSDGEHYENMSDLAYEDQPHMHELEDVDEHVSTEVEGQSAT